MFDRVKAFFRDLPGGGAHSGSLRSGDDPKVAAAALLFHVMNADGVRQDAEWERIKQLLAKQYALSGDELERLVQDGEQADNEAIDLYSFTTILNRALSEEEKVAFIRLMWEVVYADGELHELEDNTLWRVAELIGVDRRDRVLARQDAARNAPGATGTASDE